jgi:hypothetical protein
MIQKYCYINLHKSNSRKTLKPFKHREFCPNTILLNALCYNPAILATAAHQIVLKTSDIIHKVKAIV